MKPFESAVRAARAPVAIAILAAVGLVLAQGQPHAQETPANPDTVRTEPITPVETPPGTAAPEGAGEPTAAGDGAYDSWAPGRQWMSARLGYAKSGEDSSGHGAGGYGLSYLRMLSGFKFFRWTMFRHYSLGASVQHDLVGRFGAASEIEVSAILEMARHYRWAPTVHPYLGLGIGPVYRKTYRTGNDLRDVSLAWLVMTGLNSPITDHHVLGLDVRLTRLDGRNDPPNPVFGLGSVHEETKPSGAIVFKERPVTHWSIKASYSFTY